MQLKVTDSAAAWIAAAGTEQLKAKHDEYAPSISDKPRDVEYRAALRSAIGAELAKRGAL